MLKTVEDVSTTKKRLKIEIPADTIESEVRKGLKEAQKQAKFPGFRPGKAPMTMVEKKFGREVEADVLEKLLPRYYTEALKAADVKPVSKPVMEEQFDFKRNEPLTMTLTVEVMPKVENLTYEGITVKEVPVEVKEDEVDDVLKNITGERATYESTDDAAVAGDLVTIDYTVKEDGTAAAKDAVVKVGSGPYPQDFFDGLTGRKKDESAEVTADFPADMQSPFAGRKLTFDVTVKEVKKRTLPALDDELAKDLGLESLAQLKERVRENILASKTRGAEFAKQREILDKLLGMYSFDVPESMIGSEVARIMGEIRAAGKDPRSDEEIMTELKPHAEQSAKASILLELIGDKEAVAVSEEELKEEILSLAQRYYISPENVIKYYMTRDGSLEGVKHTLYEKKVLNLLLSKATTEKGD